MGLRYILSLCILGTVLLAETNATSQRLRRQVNYDSPEAKLYQPPLLLGAPPQPPAPIQNSYNPPISLGRSVDSNIPRSQPEKGYIHSILPPNAIPTNYHEPIAPSAATSYSVHQQPAYNEASGIQQSSAEAHSKAISHVPVQSIHKAPASEIQSEKGPAAKEKDNKNDEYVVYYYYYYDNDTTPNNNLSLNFDDIPSLESYDEDKTVKEPQKSASARTLATNINSVVPIAEDPRQGPASHSSSSQPRSASGPNKETIIKSDRTENFEDSLVQPLKPVSNIYRYGANEVPRFPVLPNFIVSEAPTTTKSNDIATPVAVTSEYSTPEASVNSQFPNLGNSEDEDDDLNNVLDNSSVLKSNDDKSLEDDIYTTTVSTTEAPTTTEIPTTTTEKPSRRRPSVNGGRRRFNQSPSSFSSTRTRAPTKSSTSSSTSTTTTSTLSPPTRRSFQSNNRVRPRPSINTNRGRSSSRTTESNDSPAGVSSTTESTTQSSTTAKARFTSAPRRFQSSRSRQSPSQTSSSTSTTSRPFTSSQSSVRSRPTSRRPNLVSRNRPARPGFLRPRPGSEVEVTETTTPEPEETSPSQANEKVPVEENNESSSESEETTEEEPTTTEASRFSALFRPRNRGSLGNRPRPVIGNRPSRS